MSRRPPAVKGVIATVEPMSLDAALLAELKATKATIDGLQLKLKQLVAELRERGASAQEIAEALRS
jgi:hypothetical protein